MGSPNVALKFVSVERRGTNRAFPPLLQPLCSPPPAAAAAFHPAAGSVAPLAYPSSATPLGHAEPSPRALPRLYLPARLIKPSRAPPPPCDGSPSVGVRFAPASPLGHRGGRKPPFDRRPAEYPPPAGRCFCHAARRPMCRTAARCRYVEPLHKKICIGRARKHNNTATKTNRKNPLFHSNNKHR